MSDYLYVWFCVSSIVFLLFIVLQENPDDKEAFHCKVVSLIHQSFFREAVDVINSAPKKG